MTWHFDTNTGSPFWLAKRAELGFDPIRDVRSAADLVLFPDVSAELRSVTVRDLVPKGLSDRVFQVYESGGTTGEPKRIVDCGYRVRMLAWARQRLLELGAPPGGDWLHLGPTGPHVAGSDVARHSAMGGGFFHSVDFDPRWVKHLMAHGLGEIAEKYLEHLLDQAEPILRTQEIAVLNTTPPVLEAICARPELYELVQSKVEAILWAGTSISLETLRQLREVFFPDTVIAGVYGNSLMGIAPQRRPVDDDIHPCVFTPFPETTRIELVGADGQPVDYGERGRVRLHLVTEEMFLPNVLERDTAVRVKPVPGEDVDGLADVQTYRALDEVEIIEGVY